MLNLVLNLVNLSKFSTNFSISEFISILPKVQYSSTPEFAHFREICMHRMQSMQDRQGLEGIDAKLSCTVLLLYISNSTGIGYKSAR